MWGEWKCEGMRTEYVGRRGGREKERFKEGGTLGRMKIYC